MTIGTSADAISDDALRAAGFKWHDVERSGRHWLLWIGGVGERERTQCYEDLGLELGTTDPDGSRNLWLRADYAGRYSRFIHIRRVFSMRDIAELFVGCTGVAWNPANHFYGLAFSQEGADRQRAEIDRMDRRVMRGADTSPTAWVSDVADADAARPMIGWQPPSKAERNARKEDGR